MRIRKTVLIIGAIAAGLTASAVAHPGSNLLISSKAPRAAMSGGVTFEPKNGVHLYRGAKRIAGGASAPSLKYRGENNIEVKIIQRRQTWRRLCTQGFYSGDCQGARRTYNQGFWSGY